MAPLRTRSPRATVWRYAAGSLATGGFSTLPGLVLLYYLTDTLAVSAIWGGLIIVAVKVWDVVADPVIGALSDADDRRYGSRRRCMALGAVLLPILFFLTFTVPSGASPLVAILWVGIAFLGAATAFSVFQVPYMTLPAALTDDYDERTKLLTARVIVLTIAILAFGGGGPALRETVDDLHLGYIVMAAVCAVMLGLGCWIAIGSAPKHASEPAVTSVREAYIQTWDVLRNGRSLRALVIPFFLQAVATGLMLAAAQYVATYVLQSESAVTLLFVALIAPAIVAAPVWQWLSVKTSKRFAFQASSVVFVIAGIMLMITLWTPDVWVYLPVAIAGFGYAGMQSLPMAMLPDAMSHDLARTGVDRSGVIGGVWTAMETTGFAIGGAVLSLVLAIAGYEASYGGVDQTDSVHVTISIAFSVVPAALVVVSLIPLGRYRLTRRAVHHDAEIVVEHRDEA